jgi:hypothetical protein
METNTSLSPVNVLPFGVSSSCLFVSVRGSKTVRSRFESGGELVGNRNYVRAICGWPEPSIPADPALGDAGQIR